MLVTLNTIDEYVKRTVKSVGRDQYNKYHDTVIKHRTHSIHEPIKRNSLSLITCPTHKIRTKQTGQISMVKVDVALFSRLYVTTQHR